MKTMTEIAADIAANLAANMADIQQRMSKLDATLEDLRAAGVELEIVAHGCYAIAHASNRVSSNVTIHTTNHPTASTVRHIIEKHGGDWYITESRAVLSDLYGNPFVRIEGVDLTEPEPTP